MRNLTIILSSVILFTFCEKSAPSQPQEISKKYARYRIAAFKDADLKTYATTLEKAEPVSLMDELDGLDKAGKTIGISKVKLADDSTVFMESRHLGGTPMVTTAVTGMFVRPVEGAKVSTQLPPGTIGFILEEKPEWAKVAFGNVAGKWIGEGWIKAPLITDAAIIREAAELENAIAQLKDASKQSAAFEKIQQIADGGGPFSDVARNALPQGTTEGDSGIP